MTITNIFVGCSSVNTNNEIHNKMAEKMGNFIVMGNHNLVFGGCDMGLMGEIYSVVSRSPNSKIFIAAAKAYGVFLKPLSYSKIYRFDTINQRKDAFIALSDVVVFLPGGVGTADELLTAIETKRGREHDLPIVIINAGGFFDQLLSFLKQVYDEGLADPGTNELYFVAKNFDEAANYLSSFSK